MNDYNALQNRFKNRDISNWAIAYSANGSSIGLQAQTSTMYEEIWNSCIGNEFYGISSWNWTWRNSRPPSRCLIAEAIKVVFRILSNPWHWLLIWRWEKRFYFRVIKTNELLFLSTSWVMRLPLNLTKYLLKSGKEQTSG